MSPGQMLDLLLGVGKEYPKTVDFSVTVLVPAYNEEASIAKTIVSLKNQTYPVERILVIDDCSTDNTRQIALDLGADVVTTPEQTGTKARAQNHVLPLVDTDVIVTVDGDTYLAPDAIEKILPPLADPKMASVCGFVVPQRIKTFWERAPYVEYLYGLSVIKATQSNWSTCMVSSGCFSAYQTEILKQFGGFPPRSIVEDMDLTWDQLEQGYQVVMAPEARCYPVAPPNYVAYRDQVERWQRGLFQVISLHKGKLLRNKRLCFVAGWGLIEGLLSLAPLIAMGFGLFNRQDILTVGLTTMGLIGISIVAIAAMLEARKEHKTCLALSGVPCYFLVSSVNMYLFWKALVLEWVLGRKLTTWNKGH